MRNRTEKPAGVLSKVSFPNPETTTVWSFPVRGAWGTHNGKYRGNFAPQVARNVLEMYSRQGDLVLDPMAGGGTTLIECKLLGRRFIGADINPAAVKLCEKAVDFCVEDAKANPKPEARNPKQVQNSNYSNSKQNTGMAGQAEDKQISRCARNDTQSGGMIVCADARDLSFIADGSVDLILTHPPYMNIIRYSDRPIEGDLSNISTVKKFRGQIRIVADEFFRVLKGGGHCAILIGDTRRGRHFVPLAYRVMDEFLGAGFVLKEDIIKVQHNCGSTSRWVGKAAKAGFYLIMHEHLFVFRRPEAGEDLSRIRESGRGGAARESGE